MCQKLHVKSLSLALNLCPFQSHQPFAPIHPSDPISLTDLPRGWALLASRWVSFRMDFQREPLV